MELGKRAMSPNQSGVHKRTITPDRPSQTAIPLGKRAMSPNQSGLPPPSTPSSNLGKRAVTPNQPDDDPGMDGLGPPTIPPAWGPPPPNSKDVSALVLTNVGP